MKKLLLITGSILIISVIINGGIIPTLKEKKEVSSVDNSDNFVNYQQIYIVKEYNGKIAVFEKGRDEPYRTTNMSVNFLPDYDRELLINGIELKTQKEVDAVLEDYIS